MAIKANNSGPGYLCFELPGVIWCGPDDVSMASMLASPQRHDGMANGRGERQSLRLGRKAQDGAAAGTVAVWAR